MAERNPIHWTHSAAGIVAASVWLLPGGCAQNSAALHEVTPPTIERRDAFYDAARISERVLIVVGKHGKILRTEDGGETWSLVPSGVTRSLFSIAFTDDTHGIIVGASGTCLESADGGRSWSARSLGTDRQLFVIRFGDGGTGFILGEFATLLRSENRGKDWQPVTVDWEAMLPELFETLGVVEPHLYDVAICGPDRAWVVGEYGLILASADGGKTWSKQRGGGLFDRHLFAVTCAGDMKMVAGGQGGEILYTTDGGAHWAEAVRASDDVYDLVFVAERNHLLALGDLGLMLFSSAVGNPTNWKPLSAGGRDAAPASSWFARGLASATDLFIVGQSGVKRVDLRTIPAAST